MLSQNPGTGVGTAVSPDVVLLKRAVLAFRSGDKDVARDLLAEATEHNPDNELVWLWRASAARTKTEARTAVERVLELDPSNEKALQWIQKLKPPSVAPPVAEAVEEARSESVPAQNGATNGVAQVEEEQDSTEVETAGEEARGQSAEEDAVVEQQAEAEAEELLETGERPVDGLVEEGADAVVEEQVETASEERAETAAHEPAEAVVEEQAEATTEEQAEAAEEERAEATSVELVESAASEELADAAEEEQAQATAEVQAETPAEEHVEPQEEVAEPSDAEERLAALEAYLQGGSGDEDAQEQEESASAQQAESYGWGPSQEESSPEAGAAFDAATAREGDEDPLLGLLDARERSGADASDADSAKTVEAELDSKQEEDREPAERPTFEASPSQSADEEDVWSSLGMAAMEPPTAATPVAERQASEETLQADTVEETGSTPPVETAAEGEDVGCFICEKLAQVQEGMCSSCRSIVDLRLHELAPRHEGADRATLTRALERLREKIEDEPTAELCVQAALTSLNLKQSNQALAFLREACRLRPHDREILNYYDQIESRPLILAVDDSKTVQKMISTVLEKESYRVSAAEDGLAAIAKLDEEMPALILLDITMPRMDGYQVCKVINGNEATKHIPVIMLSGKDGFFDKVRGKMVGASNYITKPFDPAELTRTIAKFVKKDD